jgi:hypothetical protein
MPVTMQQISRSLSLLDNAVMYATRAVNDSAIHAKRRALEARLLDTRSEPALAEVGAFARDLYRTK